MTDPLPRDSTTPWFRRFIFNRYTAVAFLAGAAVVAGVGGLARSEAMSGWHHGMMDGPQSAADVSAHVDHMLKHFYVEVDATEAQKAQIGPLVKQAVDDLLPLHSQLRAAHVQAMQALEQPTVDRASLETARLRTCNCRSGLEALVQLIADVGDVLTPPQRKAFAEHMRADARACRTR